MPIISFQPWKAALVETEQCYCTIRPDRKHPIMSGDKLYLWQCQRSPKRRRIGVTRCATVTPIWIGQGRICLKDKFLGKRAQRELALTDGFKGVREFFEFFQQQYKRLPLKAVLIQWSRIQQQDDFDAEKRRCWVESLDVGSLVYVGGFPAKHSGVNVIVRRRDNVMWVVSGPEGHQSELCFAVSERRGICSIEQVGRRGLWLGDLRQNQGRILQRAGFREVS